LAAAAAAAAANALAYVFSLYEMPWFDEALHAFTLFALTFLAARLLRRDLAPARAGAYLGLILALGVALGAAWEIAGWAYDSFSGPGSAIKGKDDTMFDLVWDAVGAALAAALALRRR
jgi:lysylphosphatidylglycerol synthetase-like protein (DUF2156 family)